MKNSILHVSFAILMLSLLCFVKAMEVTKSTIKSDDKYSFIDHLKLHDLLKKNCRNVIKKIYNKFTKEHYDKIIGEHYVQVAEKLLHDGVEKVRLKTFPALITVKQFADDAIYAGLITQYLHILGTCYSLPAVPFITKSYIETIFNMLRKTNLTELENKKIRELALLNNKHSIRNAILKINKIFARLFLAQSLALMELSAINCIDKKTFLAKIRQYIQRSSQTNISQTQKIYTLYRIQVINYWLHKQKLIPNTHEQMKAAAQSYSSCLILNNISNALLGVVSSRFT